MSSSPTFDKYYSLLNPQQRLAVDTIEGPVMVSAGPGTGKTQVLTLRIANILLQTQVNPENILALTFTESGVLNMRKRLVEIVGTSGYKVEINTFHGFSNDIIKRFPESFPDLISSESITEVEQIQLMEEILNEVTLEVLKPFGDPLYHLRNLISAINDLKKEGVTPEGLFEGIQKQKEEFSKVEDLYHEKGAYKGQMKGKYQEELKDIKKEEELYLVYQKYQEELRKRKRYDFNDMLLSVVEALKNDSSLLMILQEAYQYILVDEHQDTNTAQNTLIEYLCSYDESPNLFVVGDEKQAIYRFQGASLENFLYFKNLYPSAVLISLEENYRSTQSILDASGSLISKNLTSEALGKPVRLKANADFPEELIKIVELSDYHGEYYFVGKSIKKRVDEDKVKLSDIAVLSRNNRDLLPLGDILDVLGIPYVIEGDQNVFSSQDVRKLILLFRAVCNIGNDTHLANLMHVDFLGLHQMDIYKLIRYGASQKISLYEAISDQSYLKEAGVKDSEKFLKLYQNLNSWKIYCHNENLETVMVNLLKESGLLDYVMAKPNRLEILDKLAGIYEDIKIHTNKNPNFNLEDYLRYLDLLEEHQILIKKTPQSSLKNAVRLMTAHRSKGLEFEYVYIINGYDTHWGNLRRRSTGIKIPWEYLGIKLKLGVDLEAIDDERRLFYVALTRAKKEAVISYSNRSLEGREQVASQFISEIEDNLKEILDVSEFENEFLVNKEIILTPKLRSTQSLKDQDFFQELFKERGISATGLNNYLKCPWRFFYHDLLKLPTEKNKFMILGSSIHKAINKYLKALKDNQSSVVSHQSSDKLVDKEGEEYLVSAFKEALVKEALTGREYQELLKKGETTLRGYYKNNPDILTADLKTEVFISGVSLTPEIKLVGMIDAIKTLKGDKVMVYDFKTGNPKSRKETEGDYLRQLLFYKILLDRYHNGRMNMVKGAIIFLETTNSGKYKQEEFEILPDNVKEVEEQIKFVSREIMNLEFWDRRCEDKDCEYCKLRALMS